jgi:hypothetical protein
MLLFFTKKNNGKSMATEEDMRRSNDNRHEEDMRRSNDIRHEEV